MEAGKLEKIFRNSKNLRSHPEHVPTHVVVRRPLPHHVPNVYWHRKAKMEDKLSKIQIKKITTTPTNTI